MYSRISEIKVRLLNKSEPTTIGKRNFVSPKILSRFYFAAGYKLICFKTSPSLIYGCLETTARFPVIYPMLSITQSGWWWVVTTTLYLSHCTLPHVDSMSLSQWSKSTFYLLIPVNIVCQSRRITFMTLSVQNIRYYFTQ